ncbi:hypothetical protein BV25DRAFT_754036 [Artomyces pyxidatus]|uniref:Uncharacterized protein n=1 Tax=Artomyces pyxidatus TaxID=48021 RepID=A0ACB8SYF2_9AGAM|nr:hypothetical protein BV25DRAFT_754036 [Artomyces pyxidatus]
MSHRLLRRGRHTSIRVIWSKLPSSPQWYLTEISRAFIIEELGITTASWSLSGRILSIHVLGLCPVERLRCRLRLFKFATTRNGRCEYLIVPYILLQSSQR